MSTQRSFSPYGGKQADPNQPQRSPLECMAEGCPLPGVFRVSNDTSICRAHDNVPAKDWQAITARVVNRERAFLTAIDLTNSLAFTDPPARVVAAYVKSFGAEFERRTKHFGMPGQKERLRGTAFETARDYGQRVYLMLLDQVRGDLGRQLPVDLTNVMRESWKPLSESTPQGEAA